MSDRGVWGVALERLVDDLWLVEVFEFARFADVVPFVRAAHDREDVVVSSVFDIESGFEVEVQLTAHAGQPPSVTLFPRQAGRWRSVYPGEMSDVMPEFVPVAA